MLEIFLSRKSEKSNYILKQCTTRELIDLSSRNTLGNHNHKISVKSPNITNIEINKTP